jgi:hypothetical protein
MPSNGGVGGAEPIVGAVRGFRWWRINGSWLISPWRGDVRWARDDNVASCLGRRWFLRWKEHGGHHERGVPDPECSCGFYAMLRTPSDGIDPPGCWPLNPSLSGGPVSLVFGAVRGSGRVILGEYGWRAEHAQVDALYVPLSRTTSGAIEIVAESYRAPIYRDLPTLCDERGPDTLTMDLAQLPS